jgi:hypothetical protein
MRLVYEHILLPGVFIKEPTMLVTIQHNQKELGVYGFDLCSEKELGTGILCRACELMRCSMVDLMLNKCRGIITVNGQSDGGQIVFIYDENNYTFKEQ